MFCYKGVSRTNTTCKGENCMENDMKYELSLICFFLYLDRNYWRFCPNTGKCEHMSAHIRENTDTVLSKYANIRIQFCPYTGKYGLEKARI